MPRNSLCKISEGRATGAYIIAYQERIDFARLFDSKDIRDLFLRDSSRNNTKPELIFGNFIPAISITVAPSTKLHIQDTNNDYSVKPNMFLISVCAPGGGKSQAFQQYLQDPLTKIEIEKNLDKITFPEFTHSGLYKTLEKTNGVFLWASDEFAPALASTISGCGQEWQTFRGLLNNLYSGSSMAKAFGTKTNASTGEVFFSIAGSTQPHPYCDLIDKICSDGLLDRQPIWMNSPLDKTLKMLKGPFLTFSLKSWLE